MDTTGKVVISALALVWIYTMSWEARIIWGLFFCGIGVLCLFAWYDNHPQTEARRKHKRQEQYFRQKFGIVSPWSVAWWAFVGGFLEGLSSRGKRK